MTTEFIDSQAVHDSTVEQRRIVVGFDGSDGAAAAVEWAAREAEARAASLQVVTCWAVPHEVDFTGVGERQIDGLRAMVRAVERRHPHLDVRSKATNLDPRDDLIHEAETADLMVIGSSEASAARRLLLGSVARTASRRSSCPVVVVNGTADRAIRRIVVGVDGSNASSIALDWACAEAELHHAELEVVHAWEQVITRDEAQHMVDLAVDECCEHARATVRGRVVDGPPALALAVASRNADLLAIGSRGRSGFKTALFGSVALAVTETSACPVAITHPRMRQARTQS
ncbi:MAG: hypothetical protein JWN99_1658 [Ilumatobacteraceae bacterium]|nr:hypothetical protein [Ilumatobacteraceae bacterium]